MSEVTVSSATLYKTELRPKKIPHDTPKVTCLKNNELYFMFPISFCLDINNIPIKPIIIANKICEVRIKPTIIISNRVVCITSVLENATPIANDRRVNNFIRTIVNKIWQMLAAIKKNHVVDEKFLSITNSRVSKKSTDSRATKGSANINRE